MTQPIIGIKCVTGEMLLGQVSTRLKGKSLLDPSPATEQEACVENVRIVVVGQGAQGQMLTQLGPWIPFAPSLSFSMDEWYSYMLFAFPVPKQLEDIYLQSVTGIQIAGR